MHFLWTCCGAAGKSMEITAPDIDKICPACNTNMILVDGRGFINSGTHSFWAKCPACGKLEKFNDYELWKKCLHISLNPYGTVKVQRHVRQRKNFLKR